MVDAKRLLDALLGAVPTGTAGAAGSVLDKVLATLNQSGAGQQAGQVLNQAVGGLRDAAGGLNAAAGPLSARVDDAVAQATGRRGAGTLVDEAKRYVSENPQAAQAAVAGIASLLLASRRGRGLAAGAAGLGGLALIGGLAYRAFQNRQAGRPLLDLPQGGSAQGASSDSAPAGQPAPALSASPAPSSPAPAAPGQAPLGRPTPPAHASLFDPSTATEDDAMLYVRAMVAAASADGQVDEGERERIGAGLGQAGIDPEATRWLERELAAPASVDEIAAGVQTPEKAAQVYAAARIAIDPDTLQEREFLRQLREALDLDPEVAGDIDAGAAALRA
ncbi:MAG TPA: DUF533 domain-containing protein [Beijerinckiaceae bacterium]|jgi:uncharacterized membrane protein YebE (DUF533 family)